MLFVLRNSYMYCFTNISRAFLAQSRAKVKIYKILSTFQHFQTSKLGVMFDRFASQVEIDGDDIEYVLDGRVLKRSDTCQEVGITITSFVHASKVAHLDLSAQTQLLTAAVPVINVHLDHRLTVKPPMRKRRNPLRK